MSLLRKLFFRRPPAGLLEISDRIYVFECCFTSGRWDGKNYRGYLAGVVSEVLEHYADAAMLVINFRKSEGETPISNIMSEYGMTTIDYPWHYGGCPILSMELIHRFLRSTESWLALGPDNVLLLHCERGGWPVLAFMLAALLIYRKQYSGEHRTLDMVYKQAPRGLLRTLSLFDPIPSQVRYLQYVSRRNVASPWPPSDRTLTLDSIILRLIPDFCGEGGCCLSFRVYGLDPFTTKDPTPKLLFPTQHYTKSIRFYNQAESELVKIDINCNIQGDVVLECSSLHKDMEHEDMMFRITFNTAFVRSNILMLNRDDIDVPWDAKDQFPKDFRVEVLLSDMDAPSSVVLANLSCFEEKEGLPMEAFAKVQEYFSHVDWLGSITDSHSIMQKVLTSHSFPEQFVIVPDLVGTVPVYRSSRQMSKEEQKSFNFCNSVDQDEQDLLCQKVSKDHNLGQQQHELNNKIAAICLDTRMLSVTSCVPRNNDMSPDGTKGGKIASGVSLLSETIPSMMPLPLSSSIENSLSVIQKNALPSFPIQLPQQPYVTGLEVDLTCKDDHTDLEDASQSFLTASGSEVSILTGGPLPPSATVKQPSINPINEDSSIMARCSPVFSSTRETPLRKDPMYKIANLSLPSPPRTPVTPPSLQSTLRSSFGPAHLPPLPPTAAACSSAVPLSHPGPSLKEKSTKIVAENYLPSLPNVPAQTSEDKLAEIRHLPSQALASPFKDSAEKSGPSLPPPPPPPPLPPTPPLKENFGKAVPPPDPLPPQKSGSSSSFQAPPPPPGPEHQSQKPQVSPSVPSAPLPPASFDKGFFKMGSTAPPPPLSSLNVKGQSFSRSTGSENFQTRKLKPLHWLKLTRAVQGSLWAETQKSRDTSIASEIDMTELENLFSASAPNSDQGVTGGKSRRGFGAPKSDFVQLIDHRKAYNCEIMLSKFKVPLQNIMGSVLSLKDSSLDIDQVENLVKFCPTKEEMELLKRYMGEIDKLGKCEQFFLELMRVPRVEAKLRVFLFKMQFRSQVSDLRKNLNIVNSAADQIRSSVKLKRIMQTVLSLGNALNKGTARGSAVGFRLDSLLKLAEIRARNIKMTLMHYLCKIISEKFPELLDFSEDLGSIEPASKIQLKFLAEEMQTVNKGLEMVVQELSVSENDGPISDEFRKNLKKFLCLAEAEARSLTLLYSGVGRNVDALIGYFGEDPARCPFEQVVNTLLKFARMFNRALEENCKQHELEEKKSEKELGIQKPGAKK